MAYRIKAGYFKHASFYSQSLIKDNYEKAALLGNANGMMNLGTLYGNGRHGVERCNVKALEWWTKAAALGDGTAMKCLKILESSKKLCVACREGDFNTVKTLLASGNVNANFQREDGETPLFAASGHGFLNIVQVLLSRKLIEINQADNEGTTPLSAASQHGWVNVVNALLARTEIEITKPMKKGTHHSSWRARKTRWT